VLILSPQSNIVSCGFDPIEIDEEGASRWNCSMVQQYPQFCAKMWCEYFISIEK
jgi:hypothetical protein